MNIHPKCMNGARVGKKSGAPTDPMLVEYNARIIRSVRRNRRWAARLLSFQVINMWQGTKGGVRTSQLTDRDLTCCKRGIRL